MELPTGPAGTDTDFRDARRKGGRPLPETRHRHSERAQYRHQQLRGGTGLVAVSTRHLTKTGAETFGRIPVRVRPRADGVPS